MLDWKSFHCFTCLSLFFYSFILLFLKPNFSLRVFVVLRFFGRYRCPSRGRLFALFTLLPARSSSSSVGHDAFPDAPSPPDLPHATSSVATLDELLLFAAPPPAPQPSHHAPAPHELDLFFSTADHMTGPQDLQITPALIRGWVLLFRRGCFTFCDAAAAGVGSCAC